MILGDPAAWTEKFVSLDARLLQRIEAIWPQCLAVLPDQPGEDTITINLVNVLSKDRETRSLFHWLEYQYEPFGFTDAGLAFSKGKIDMAVLLDQERERYLPYECKRLNIYNNGVRHSLATVYVTEGVARFVTEQYAEGLPIGCMLGYVLDGDVPFAEGRVHNALSVNSSMVGLVGSPVTHDPQGAIRRFATLHVRPGSGHRIEVRHGLLSCTHP